MPCMRRLNAQPCINLKPRRMWTREKKIGLAMSIILVVSALGYLIVGNFGENLVYFFTPSEVKAFPPDYYHKRVRVGGMVVKGSVKTYPNRLGMTFQLTDGHATIPVTFDGIPPDLFKEGQGAVVEGYWSEEQLFHSNLIMAKHSEDYMPIELKRAGATLPRKDFLKTLVPSEDSR
ncbi:MAG: cytochrome c maturation protein CcmE [Nitrospirae bacterium]|nr:MAG: cytochrome c maturation protein CcmE [Nitrospirota bacterium]